MPRKKFSFDTEQPHTTAPEQIDAFISGKSEDIARKTIAIPEKYFKMVKIEAAKRDIPAYVLWGEIVESYFTDSPVEANGG